VTGVPPQDARDLAPQFALPLVVRVERAEPPARTDALEAAAVAVLTLLTDPRSAGDGEWAAAVAAWVDARIRKVVRRARGAEWRRAEALDGITVTRGSAQVRVFPPVPVDDWPRDLARLQVAGTELADPRPLPAPAPGVPVLWLNPDLELTAGKAMAQVGHAAQLGLYALDPATARRWKADGFPLAVRTAEPTRWADLLRRDLPVVRDGGFTEVAPGTCTAVAEVPNPRRAPPSR
jgi:peptidyl-tRNA hydrolase